MTKELSVKRQADRLKMAQALTQLALDHDCTVQRTQGGTYPGPRCIQLALRAPGGLSVTVNLDAASWQPDTYVLNWHIASDSDRKLAPYPFGGSVNPHHFCKATYVAQGFKHLVEQLRKGLEMAKNGTAYQATPV